MAVDAWPWGCMYSIAPSYVDRFRICNAGLSPERVLEAAPPEPLAAHIEGTVGIVEVRGLLVKYPCLLGGLVQCTAYLEVERVVGELAANPTVSAILLHIRSDGGEIAGLDSRLLPAVQKAQRVKPVAGFVQEAACGAAYIVAAACRPLLAAPTARIGSIGSCMLLSDWIFDPAVTCDEAENFDDQNRQLVSEMREACIVMVQEVRPSAEGFVLPRLSRGGFVLAEAAERHRLIDGICPTLEVAVDRLGGGIR